MADEVVVPATTSAGAGIQQETAPAAEKPGVSPELTERLTKLERQLNFLVAKETKQAKAEPKVEAEPPTVREDLAKLRADILEERKTATNERRDAAISTAIAQQGVGTTHADLLFDHIQARFGAQIKVEGRAVVVEDPTTGERQTVTDFVAGLLKGPKGELFKAAPAPGPETKGLGSRQSGSGTRRAYHELSTEEQDKLMKEGKAGAYVKEDLASGR